MNEWSNAAGGGSASRRWFAVIVVSLLMAGLVGMHALWTGSSTAHTETTSTLIAVDSTGGDHDAAGLPGAHTRTHTHTHARTRTHTRARAHARTHTHTGARHGVVA